MKVLSFVPRWRIEKYGVALPANLEMVYLSELNPEELKAAQAEAGGVLAESVTKVDAAFMDACPNLKIIHTEGVGFNGVDLAAARERGIDVCNNRDCNKTAVAEHVICSIMAVLKRLNESDARMKADVTKYMEIQSDMRSRGVFELSGKHVGIVGFGAIGREVARILNVLGCQISFYDAFPPAPEVAAALNATQRTAEEIFEMCDIVTLHVPLLPSTENMVNAECLKKMKPNAIIVNAARGEVVDQKALADALENDVIFGAAIDTVSPEPPAKDHPLFNLSEKAAHKLLLTPHVAGTTDEAFIRMHEWAFAGLSAAAEGKTPNNIVNAKK